MEKGPECSDCHSTVHRYPLSLPVVIHLRRDAWVQPFMFTWTLLWSLLLMKLLWATPWFADGLTETLVDLIGLMISTFIGTVCSVYLVHLKRDSTTAVDDGSPVAIIMAISQFTSYMSIALPVAIGSLLLIHYVGWLLLGKFPMDIKPFTMGTYGSIVLFATVFLLCMMVSLLSSQR